MRLITMTLRLAIPIFLSALVEWGLIALVVVALFFILPGHPHISFALVVIVMPFATAFLAISLVRTGLLIQDKTTAPNIERMIRNSFLFLSNVGLTLAVITSLFLVISTLLYFGGHLERENLQLLVFQPIRAFETGVAQSMISPTTIVSFVIFLIISLYIFCCNMMPLAAAAADVADNRASFDRFWGFGVARNLFFRFALIILAVGLPVIYLLLQPIIDAFILDHKAIVALLLGDKRNTVIAATLSANLVNIGLAGIVFTLMFSIMAAIITAAFVDYREYVDRLDKYIE